MNTQQKIFLKEYLRDFNRLIGNTQLLNEELHIADGVKELTTYIEHRLSKYKNPKGDNFNFSITKKEYILYLHSLGYSNSVCENLAFFENLQIQGRISNYTHPHLMSGKTGFGELNKNPKMNFTTPPNVKKHRADIKIDNPNIALYLGKLHGEPYAPRYYEVIQHEVSHLYNAIKKFHNKNYGYSKNFTKLSNMYNKSKENLNNSNDIVKLFAEIYYYLCRNEQSAFANGLYRRLISEKPNFETPENVENYLHNTVQYQQLLIFKDVLSDIDNFVVDEEWNEAKELFFGRSVSNEQVKKTIKLFLYREIPNFQKKLSGIVMKYKKDLPQITNSKNNFINLMNGTPHSTGS